MMDRLHELFNKIKTGRPSPQAVSYIIAGLGNPGPKYAATRHNVGFWLIDKLSETCQVKVDKAKFQSLTGEATISGKRVILVKPQTFMNLSGEAVSAVASFYKIPMERVLIAFDDISLPPSKIRIRKKGSAGGHNGIKSIIAECGTEEFPRIKIGVGDKPHKDYELADWVLSVMPENDRKLVNAVLEDAVRAIELIVSGQIDTAVSRYSR